MLPCRTGSLETFLHQEINIDPNVALAFLSDGRRLTNGNIRDLAGMPDQVWLACLSFPLSIEFISTVHLRVQQKLHQRRFR